MKKEFIFVEACNFIDFPSGGQLTFAKQFIKVFPNEVALVGITTDKDVKIGQWTRLQIDGKEYDFFPALYRPKSPEKPIIPARIQWTFSLLKSIHKIRTKKTQFYFTQDINSLFSINKIGKSKIIHRSAGLNNPFIHTRYNWSKIFKNSFRSFWHNEMHKTYILLAAADEEEIERFKRGSRLQKKEILSFPTRFDDRIFFPKSKFSSRDSLNLPLDKKIIVTSGRLNNVKGWDLVIEVCEKFKIDEKLQFYWLGDGEDRDKIEQKIKEKNIKNLTLVGNLNHKKLSLFLSASDLFILTSYKEGWSTSIVEALACGKNVVTTNVSSATSMIKNNENGFVIDSRSPMVFFQKILEAIELPDPNPTSISKVELLKQSELKKEFLKACQQ